MQDQTRTPGKPLSTSTWIPPAASRQWQQTTVTIRQEQVINLFSTLVSPCSELDRVTHYTKGTRHYFHLLPCWIYLVSPFSLCTEVTHKPIAGHQSQTSVTYAPGFRDQYALRCQVAGTALRIVPEIKTDRNHFYPLLMATDSEG